MGIEHFLCAPDSSPDTLPEAKAWVQSRGFATLLYRDRSERVTASIYSGKLTVAGGTRAGSWRIGAQGTWFENNTFWKSADEDLYAKGTGRSGVGRIIINKDFPGRTRLGGWVGSPVYPPLKNDSALAGLDVPQPLVGGFSATTGNARVQFSFKGSHTFEGSGNDTLFNGESGAYKNGTYAVCSDNIELTGSGETRGHRLRGSFGARMFSSARLAAGGPSMYLSGKLGLLSGAFDWHYTGTPWLPSVSGQYTFGGGYAAGYDGSGLRFALADSITVSSFSVTGKTTLPRGFQAGVSGTRHRIELPLAFMKTAPFSSWAMFDPHEFHLRNGFLEMREIAGSVNYQAGNKNLRFIPFATLFLNRITSTCITKELKALLFIPYYRNFDTISPVSLTMLMGSVGCSFAFSHGAWSLEGKLLQNAIPIYVRDDNAPQGSTGTPRPLNPEKTAFRYGGLSGWIGVSWQLPDVVSQKN